MRSESDSAAVPGTALIVLLLAIAIAYTAALRFARPVALTNSMRGDLVSTYRIDINRASSAELEVLPSIGPNLAERIVTDRNEHGPFESVEDLHRVHGIGERTIQRIEPFVRIDESTD